MDHSILIRKLELYGVDRKTIGWFRSYLSNRKQHTYVNGRLSNCLPLVCGVPQGSVLGPLLFLVYINDLPNCFLSSTVKMFADDTSLTACAKDPVELESTLNDDLKVIYNWLKVNKLTLNVNKTKYIILSNHYRLNNLSHEFELKVEHQTLKQEQCYRYLGLNIDETLSWGAQVEYIKEKISAGIAVLKRTRTLVPRKTLLLMYNALVQPYFDYCNEVWGCLNKCLSEKLQKLQNRAAKVITATENDFDTRSEDVLDELGWVPLDKMRANKLAIAVYKSVNDLHAEGLKALLKPTFSQYSRKFSKYLCPQTI